MDNLRKYAPLLHTGFGDKYTKEQMADFIGWCYDRGFNGFSAEGKAKPNTNDIDGWLEGFIRGVKYACAEAEKKDMEVWLFDEWGYPTGTAAGKTLASNTKWRSKRLHLAYDLHLEAGQTVELSAPEHFICAAAWPVGRDVFGRPIGEVKSIAPIDGKIVYTAARKRERLCAVSWEYDNFRTVSIFVPDPEDDKQGTLDLLSYEGVAYFISQMHESYPDELGQYFGKTLKGFFYDEPFVSFPAPYTFDIFEEFKRKKGYDIVPGLPLMMAGIDNGALIDYRAVCTDRAADAFYGQMSRWCHAHGVQMVGHQDLDHSARTLDSVSGHFFKNMAFNDGPGVDFIWAQIAPGLFADYPRFAGSARRLLGKTHAISESFAAVGTCMYPDYMRFCMDYQIMRGINRFFLMIADPVPGETGFNTPVSKLHPQSVDFGAMLNRRVALSNMLMNTASPDAHVAIYIPMDAVFSGLVNLKRPSAVSVSPYTPVWEYIDRAAKLLCHMPVDFDYIWREAILDMPLDNGAFVTKEGQRIDTLIIPPAAIEEAEIYPKLQQFIAQGGKALFINNAPEPFIEEGIVCADVKRIARHVEPEIGINAGGMISLARRKKADETLYFLLNEDEYSIKTPVNIPAGGCIRLFDFASEQWLDVENGDDFTFAAMEMKVFAAGGEKSGKLPIIMEESAQEIGGWTALTPEGDRIYLEQLGDWRAFYKADYTGWMTYEAEFELERGGFYRLDLGRVCYAAKISVNDIACKLPFAPYAVDIELAAGKHKLIVEVLNNGAARAVGSPEAERAGLSASWLRTKSGNDRKYLESGLLGPVTVGFLRGV